jgi:uncharacterized protein YbaR (Trm112 family)
MVKDAYTVDMAEERLFPALPAEVLALLACPVCHGALYAEADEIRCAQCRRSYPVEDGIPILLADRARTSEARSGL